jgi:hypothetical protein
MCDYDLILWVFMLFFIPRNGAAAAAMRDFSLQKTLAASP